METSIKGREGKLDSQNVHEGNHEAEMCYEEADLHKRMADCKKNPGHIGFIPLEDFNTNCLPSRYHDDDLMSKTIKTMAALTVQVKTSFTSLESYQSFTQALMIHIHVIMTEEVT
ncbi:uncharacterized protein LOC131943229 [Physella acuta]|uniref:uncharacterized protein LOC131943229 n=1 Tax=Physella acuta TaxID=109671 RepID=UPI0027DDBD6F|nr:uncharacterized protein LOC131943229 [Physella acuta]